MRKKKHEYGEECDQEFGCVSAHLHYQINKGSYSHTHAFTHWHSHTLTLKLTYRHSHTLTLSQSHSLIPYIFTLSPAHSFSHIHTHFHILTLIPCHSYTLILTLSHTHTLTNSHPYLSTLSSFQGFIFFNMPMCTPSFVGDAVCSLWSFLGKRKGLNVWKEHGSQIPSGSLSSPDAHFKQVIVLQCLSVASLPPPPAMTAAYKRHDRQTVDRLLHPSSPFSPRMWGCHITAAWTPLCPPARGCGLDYGPAEASVWRTKNKQINSQCHKNDNAAYIIFNFLVLLLHTWKPQKCIKLHKRNQLLTWWPFLEKVRSKNSMVHLVLHRRGTCNKTLVTGRCQEEDYTRCHPVLTVTASITPSCKCKIHFQIA